MGIKILIGYYVLISVVLIITMFYDKSMAKKEKRRVPESTLFILALLGGGVGGFVGMFGFRHKTRKIYFHIIFALAIILHCSFVYTVQSLFM